MVEIKCFRIVDNKEIFVMIRDENKFTSKRIKDGNYIINGKKGSRWEYVDYDEKEGKAIIKEVNV